MTVSMSGSPAATSEPNASTRIARVTGQLISSLRSMADRLAALKSPQSAEEPVSSTVTSWPDSAVSGPLSASAARTISLGSALAAPAWMTPVRPSGEMDTPAVGGTTVEM